MMLCLYYWADTAYFTATYYFFTGSNPTPSSSIVPGKTYSIFRVLLTTTFRVTYIGDIFRHALCFVYCLSYHIWINMCFEVACMLHEVGIKWIELLRNGVESCHPQHGVRSGLLIFKRAAMLKITFLFDIQSKQLLKRSEAIIPWFTASATTFLHRPRG